ncbi:hypothetical protein [Chondrinema litorale]|uniref:hypothetical protein n=1 Tax=Chondrinema litorale TaxID=2994555 RepID=UPI002542AF07|nr:hypothetical protein [Chondrinema litorale]UZR98533.1 hypothetical protein OQ292_31515 [Chondrinema litorale]
MEILTTSIQMCKNKILKREFVKAPVSCSFEMMHIEYNKAKLILNKNNIVIKDSLESIEEISINNQKSPEEIVDLIME